MKTNSSPNGLSFPTPHILQLPMSFLKAVKGAANAAMGITEPIAKVREATNNEKWGPSSTIMGEV